MNYYHMYDYNECLLTQAILSSFTVYKACSPSTWIACHIHCICILKIETCTCMWIVNMHDHMSQQSVPHPLWITGERLMR